MSKSVKKPEPPHKARKHHHARTKHMATTSEKPAEKPAAPTQAPADAKKPEEKALSKEDAQLILESGGKLKKKGDPDDKWFAVGRVRNQLAVCYPLTEELKKTLLDMELVGVADAPTPEVHMMGP